MLPTPDAVRGDDTQQVGSIMKITKTKTKVEIATAVGAGYLLGRTHQLKMAVKIAGAGGRSPTGPEDLLAQGSEFLASTPDIAELGDSVRVELLDTAAATAEATSEHVDSFRDRLRSRGANVVAGGGHLVAGVKSIGRRGHAHPRDAEDSTVDDESRDDSAPESRPDTPVRRKKTVKAHKPPTDVRDEEKPHNATKGEDENQPQPSRVRARLRRITPTRSPMRKQSPPTETTPKGGR
ncbi:hypothetical protein SAMN04490220_5388 [Rhodococcus jostii]|uniref:Uncharacterized protein n=2 Tax=Rhodococcus jostii TaxID=132919 RepID=A0A1H5D4U5_RHOJO|nr:hypothetical protein SAMN04490220_5388 [Rhodococcus jostii]